MSITLSWSKKNTDDVLQQYEIYRSIDKATLYTAPNLLTTIIDKAAIAYVDTTTALNLPYWYGIRNVTVYGNADSTPIMSVDSSNPGYGSIEPIIGDYQDGFVESYFNDAVFTYVAHKIILDQLHKFYPDSYLNFAFTPISDAAGGGYYVNKFWRDGQVIFAPNHPQLGINSAAVTFANVKTNIVDPLVAAKPQVEIAGVLYEFHVMTPAEALKYVITGSKTPIENITASYSDRIVPKSYTTIYSSYFLNIITQAIGGIYGYYASGTNLTFFTSGQTTAATGGGVAIGWYFTIVNP